MHKYAHHIPVHVHRFTPLVRRRMSTIRSLPGDIRDFLADYPSLPDDPTRSANLEFYSNNLRCKPDGLKIDKLHKKWFGDYQILEYSHGFIQWLFPIRESGMNYLSQPLQIHERDAIRSSPQLLGRVMTSYKLMLDFYGMVLVDEETGLLKRSEGYAPNYSNLVRSPHNNLRISRILKCLSELGLEHLNSGFLLHVLNEQSEHGQLTSRVLRDSMDRWWINCLRNEEERKWLGEVVSKVRKSESLVDGDEGTFTRELYKSALDNRKEKGELSLE